MRPTAGAESPYERGLLHALLGDNTVFLDEKRVEAVLRVIGPVLDAATPFYVYVPDSWGTRGGCRHRATRVTVAQSHGGTTRPPTAAASRGSPLGSVYLGPAVCTAGDV
jgi:hypothetical protein